MTELIEHVGGEFGVTVIYQLDDESAVSVTFNAYEIIGLGSDATGAFVVPDYHKDGAVSSMDTVDDPRLAENYFRGFVKWDGCSHVYFGEAKNSGYIHLCGAEHIRKLSAALEAVYERCGELMKARGTNLLDGEFECAPKSLL